MSQANLQRYISPFNGTKYSVWKFRICSLLRSENLLRVIRDQIPLYPGRKWLKANDKALHLMIQNLADLHIGYAKNITSACEAMQALNKVFEQKSIAAQMSTRKKLTELKLKSEIPLTDHFANFEDLVTELIAAGDVLKEAQKEQYLLMTLPASYESVITVIQTFPDEILTVENVKMRLLDHEVKLSEQNKDTATKALIVPINESERERPRDKGRLNKNLKAKRRGKCYHCNKLVHFEKDCFSFKRMIKKKEKESEKTSEKATAQMSTVLDLTSTGSFHAWPPPLKKTKMMNCFFWTQV